MTDEEKKERQRESCKKRYANLTPEQKEERRIRQKQNRLKRETARLNPKSKNKEGKGTAKKETPKARRERYTRENAEAKALGVSYGKYQMLKSQGKLPEHIEIPENIRPQKLGVYEPAPKGFKEFNEFKERQVAMVAAEITEERRKTRAIVRGGDRAVNGYMERMKKQREAVERARVSKEA